MPVPTTCVDCGAAIDAAGRAAGESIDCRCGASVIVPYSRATAARVVRCPNCGACRSGDEPVCAFCQTRFSLSDKGWGSICPTCFCRLPSDARFCVTCGVKIEPASGGPNANLTCPGCSATLHRRSLAKVEVSECGGCGGLWLPAGCFEEICKDEELIGAIRQGLTGPEHTELSIDHPVHYLRCPQCREMMNRQNFGRISGVLIDSCRDCGVWLDNQELNQIARFLQSGGMRRSQQIEAEERLLTSGSGATAGIWSDADALGAALGMNVEGAGPKMPVGASPLLRKLARIVGIATSEID